MSDKDFQNQVGANIEYYASVDPDLVYYYIKYIEKRFGEKNTNPDSNYYNLLREKDYKYRTARNLWVQSEINAADEFSPNTLSSTVKRYLSELQQLNLNEYKAPEELPINESLSAYFTYMIVRGKKSQYNEKFNYTSANKKEFEKKKQYFDEIYSEALGLDQSKRIEMIESALGFPYLFKDSYLDKYSQSSDLSLNEFIRKLLRVEYVRKNAVRAGVFYFKDDFKHSNSMSFTEDPFPFYHIESMDEIKIGTGIFIDLGFQLGLREYLSPFSYIEIDAGYGLANDFVAENNLDPFIIQRDSYQPGTGTHTMVTYTLEERNETSHYELYGHISTPVFYFTRNFFVEAGINYFYTSVKRNCYDFSRQIDSIVSTNPDDFQEYRLNYKYEFRKGNFYPTIAFNYSILEFINVKAEYMVPLRLIAKMEVLFNF